MSAPSEQKLCEALVYLQHLKQKNPSLTLAVPTLGLTSMTWHISVINNPTLDKEPLIRLTDKGKQLVTVLLFPSLT